MPRRGRIGLGLPGRADMERDHGHSREVRLSSACWHASGGRNASLSSQGSGGAISALLPVLSRRDGGALSTLAGSRSKSRYCPISQAAAVETQISAGRPPVSARMTRRTFPASARAASARPMSSAERCRPNRSLISVRVMPPSLACRSALRIVSATTPPSASPQMYCADASAYSRWRPRRADGQN